MIEAVRRDPVGHEDLLVFLLIVFEPARRGVSKEFCRLHAGLRPAVRDVNWSNRAEARMIRELDKQQLYDVTRAAAIEAIFRYPTPRPDRLFPWLRETIAHRALDELRGELPEIEAQSENPAEARALQEALAGFDAVEPPPMREAAGLRDWTRRFDLRHLYEIVDDYFEENAVRAICKATHRMAGGVPAPTSPHAANHSGLPGPRCAQQPTRDPSRGGELTRRLLR